MRIIFKVSTFFFIAFTLFGCNQVSQITTTIDVNITENEVYQLYFHSAGGNELANLEVKENGVISDLPTPYYNNFTFLGWFIDENYTVPFNYTIMPNHDIHLYAKWEIDEFTVKIVLGYEGGSEYELITKNGKFSPTEVPMREGYDFNGFWVSYNQGITLSYLWDPTTIVNDSITLYADWIETSTIQGQLSAPTVFIENSYLEWQVVAQSEGYEIAVFIKVNGVLVEQTREVVNSTSYDLSNLPADIYTVRIRSKGNGLTSVNSNWLTRVIYHNVLGNADNFRIDYENNTIYWDEVINCQEYIIEYKSENNSEYQFLDRGSFSQAELYDFDPGTYTIRVMTMANGYVSSETIYTFTFFKLNQVKYLSYDKSTYTLNWQLPVYASHTIIEINGIEELINETSYQVNSKLVKAGEDLVITLRTYDENSDYLASSKKIIYITKSSVPSLSWDGNTLHFSSIDNPNGYQISINQSVPIYLQDNFYEFIFTNSEDVTVCVQAVDNSYYNHNSDCIEISFNVFQVSYLFDNELAAINEFVVANTILDIPLEFYEGYEILGFYEDSNYLMEIDFSQEITSSINIYVKLTPKLVNIIFDEKIDGVEPVIKIYCFGQKVNDLDIPQKDGYRFLGYYSEPNGEGKAYFDDLMNQLIPFDELNLSLYANWAKIITITLNGYFDSTTHFDFVITLGDSIGQLEVPERKGHDFLGYYMNIYGTSKMIFDEEMNYVAGFQITENIVLNPVFSLKKYTITLENEGGTGDSYINHIYGHLIVMNNLPTKEGFAFDGYYTEPNGQGNMCVSYLGNGNVNCSYEEIEVLYAKWIVPYIATLINGDDEIEVEVFYNRVLPYVKPPTKDNSTFLGYFTEPNASGIPYYFNGIYYGWNVEENLTLYAGWSHIITFNPGDGYTDQVSINLKFGDQIPFISKPILSNYQFKGYFTEKYGQGVMIFDEEMNSSQTWNYDEGKELYAYWVGNESYLTLNAMEGDSLETIHFTLNYGENYKLPIPTRFGYLFSGWFAHNDDELTIYTDMNGDSLLPWTESSEVVLYAHYQPIQVLVTLEGHYETGIYTVTFVSDGETETFKQTVTGDIGLDYPYIPQKIGYSFLGWYTERFGEGELFDFSQEINRDLTLYAHWHQCENGYFGVETSVIRLDFDLYKDSIKFTFIAPYSYYIHFETRTSVDENNDFFASLFDEQAKEYVAEYFHGYSSDNISMGAFVEGGKTYTLTVAMYNITGDKTVYLRATHTDYSYFMDGGKAGLIPTTRLLDYDNDFSLPIMESTDTFLFDGWSVMVNGAIQVITDANGYSLMPLSFLDSMTLIPKCGYQRYSITYDLDGGQTNDSFITEYYIGTPSFDLPILSKNGYVFLGWTKEVVGSEIIEDVTSIEVGNTGDLIIKARWEVVSYTLNFVTNNGEEIESQTINYRDVIIPPSDLTKTGYIFDGWYLDSGFSIKFLANSLMKEDLVLYAKWDLINYQIFYYLDGGTNPYGAPIFFTYITDTFQLLTPIKTGYNFNGWYDNPEFLGVRITKIYKNTNEDITLYASYIKNKYSITYMNDNDIIYEKLDFYYQDLINHPEDPIKTGYIFDGWYYEESFETPFIETNMLAANFNLYPKFEKTEYLITFDYQDDDVVGDESKVARIGEQYGQLPTPFKSYYTFEGWYTEIDGGLKITSNTYFTALANQTLYARWEKIHIDGYYDPSISQSLQISYSFILGTDADDIISMFATEANAVLSNGATYEVSIAWSFVFPYNPSIAGRYQVLGILDGDLPEFLDIDPIIGVITIIPEVSLVTIGIPRAYKMPISQNQLYDEYVMIYGGFKMAETETSYLHWYSLRLWAENHGYIFKNKGQEGSFGTVGALPTEFDNHPVTMISHYDVFVWLNALSEFYGYTPVYYFNNEVYKNSNITQIPEVRLTNGFSLPNNTQWEMAARLTYDSASTNGSQAGGSDFWTPRNYASGATAYYYNEEATQAVAWYSKSLTNPTSSLLPNAMGLYDMSGNVGEMIFPEIHYFMGGSYSSQNTSLDLKYTYNLSYSQLTQGSGFRIFQNPYPNAIILDMSQIGEKEQYTFPRLNNDTLGYQILGGYQLAQSETTYGTWEHVYEWAIMNNYNFENDGLGSFEEISDNIPVANISYRDILVWLNALSEMNGLTPRYVLLNGEILRDSRDENASAFQQVRLNQENGYRLPNDYEWEMAARWTNYYGVNDYTVYNGSRIWQKGVTASGALGLIGNEYETGRVSWSTYNTTIIPQPVKTKLMNHLYLYDMSGNLHEFVTSYDNLGSLVKGHNVFEKPSLYDIAIFHSTSVAETDTSPYVGFRILLD